MSPGPRTQIKPAKLHNPEVRNKTLTTPPLLHNNDVTSSTASFGETEEVSKRKAEMELVED